MASNPFLSVTTLPQNADAADTGAALEAPLPPPLSLRDLLLTRQPRLVVTPAILAANVAVFAVMATVVGAIAFSPVTLVRWGGEFAPAIVAGEWWRLLASMWLHLHPLHLLLNAVMLWQLGIVVERLLGPLAFVVVYLLSGVLAAVTSLQWLPSGVVGVGASGAIFGMIGVLLAVAFVARQAPGFARLMSELRIRLIGIVIANLVLGALLPGIDNAAHVGGLAAGLGLGWLVGRESVTAAPPLRRTLIPIALTAALATVAVVRLDDRQDVRTQMAHFDALHAQADAAFRSARADADTKRLPRADAAASLEHAVLPALRAAQQRGDALLRAEHFRIAASRARGDGSPGGGPWRPGKWPLEAHEWTVFLARYEEVWRLRVRGLRDDDASAFAEADARETRALRLFSARLERSRGPAPE